MTASIHAANGVRLALFAFFGLLLSVLVITIDLFAIPFLARAGLATIYGTAAAACGVLGILLRAWRRDAPIIANLSASLICFVVPAAGFYVFFFYLIQFVYPNAGTL